MLIGRSFSYYTLYLQQREWTGALYSSDNVANVLGTLFRFYSRNDHCSGFIFSILRFYMVRVLPCN